MTPAPFRILKFWTTYTPKDDGTMKAVDMVSYCPIGQADRHVVVEAVSRLAKTRPLVPGSNDIATEMAHARWSVIEPAYRAWKDGQDMPLNGTPLGAWPQLNAEQAEALRTAGLRTVEEVAGLGDDVLSRVNLPNARDLRTVAKAYLTARDQAAASSELIAMKRENDDMRSQLEDMRQIILNMQQGDGDPDLTETGEQAPRRRGRPPKATTEATA